MRAIKAIKPGKAAGPSATCNKIIFASREVERTVMTELLQYVLHGKRIPDERQTSVMVPIFKEIVIKETVIHIETCKKDHCSSVGEKHFQTSECLCHATSFYARQKNDRHILYCEKYARGIYYTIKHNLFLSADVCACVCCVFQLFYEYWVYKQQI